MSDEGRILYIFNTSSINGGTYTCTAKNKAGSSQLEYTVNVLLPPTLRMNEVNDRAMAAEKSLTKLVRISDGESFSTECPIDGNPKPTFYWYEIADGKFITENLLVTTDITLVKIHCIIAKKSYKYNNFLLFQLFVH